MFSVAISSVVTLCVLVGFSRFFSTWGSLETSARYFITFVSIHLIALTLSGWLYLRLRRRVFGIVHAALMFCIAGCGAYFGLMPLMEHSYPVESLAALVPMIYAAVGLLALICTICMVWDLRTAKKRDML